MSRTFFNWSSGKDSALALYYLLQGQKRHPDLLVTTVNKDLNRISMHGLREELLDIQANSIGLTLKKIYLSGKVSMKYYNAIMHKTTSTLKKQGYSYAGFGDIFLEDLKKYREEQLQKTGLKAIFPLWKKDTKSLINEFIELGFKAITVSVNAKLLDKSFVGRTIDHDFIKDLPQEVDVCGENGEFHTFVYDGPIFRHPVNFKIGEKVLKHYDTEKDSMWNTAFWYCDLLPFKS